MAPISRNTVTPSAASVAAAAPNRTVASICRLQYRALASSSPAAFLPEIVETIGTVAGRKVNPRATAANSSTMGRIRGE